MTLSEKNFAPVINNKHADKRHLYPEYSGNIYCLVGLYDSFTTTSCLKKQLKLFWHNFVKFPPTLIIFASYLIYVNALLCETQMLQIVTLRGNYLYQMAHFCLISSTEAATWFNNFKVLNILC